jgi:nicotinamidase-related amidase
VCPARASCAYPSAGYKPQGAFCTSGANISSSALDASNRCQDPLSRAEYVNNTYLQVRQGVGLGGRDCCADLPAGCSHAVCCCPWCPTPAPPYDSGQTTVWWEHSVPSRTHTCGACSPSKTAFEGHYLAALCTTVGLRPRSPPCFPMSPRPQVGPSRWQDHPTSPHPTHTRLLPAGPAPHRSVPVTATTLYKGVDRIQNSYSAFGAGTDVQGGSSLRVVLANQRVTRLFVVGLGTEHGLLHTVLDALLTNTYSQVVVVQAATRVRCWWKRPMGFERRSLPPPHQALSLAREGVCSWCLQVGCCLPTLHPTTPHPLSGL